MGLRHNLSLTLVLALTPHRTLTLPRAGSLEYVPVRAEVAFDTSSATAFALLLIDVS
jgi:hypothetical protein